MDQEMDGLDFAVEHDRPIRYLERISTYYQTLGYGKPYRWAQYAEVPFTGFEGPLSKARVGLITTAAPYQEGKGDQGPGAPYNAAAKFYRVYTGRTDATPDLRVSHVGIDRKHTTAEDMNTWFPLAAMRRAAAAGRIGALAPRFYGAPTNRSQRTTIEQDCAELAGLAREDRLDAALLVAN